MQRISVGSDGAQRLGAIPLFADLSPGQRSMLARVLDEVLADAGETLMTEGEQGFEMMMIEEGGAEVRRHGEPVSELGPGDFFGEMAVLEDGAPRSASVIALTPLRGLLFTARFARTIHDRMPEVGARMEQAARAHHERDARAEADGA